MQPSTADPIESARLFYAKELCRINHISSSAILRAFSTVPRERFVGSGPWMIQSSGTEYFTESDEPRNVYQDALIVLDAAKRLNNGQPSLWAFHLSLLNVRPGDHILHLGCGTGYYSAILAELTGPRGNVVAVEIDEGLAARARIALEPWPQVTVVHANGAQGPFDSADVIVVSAGATHPLPLGSLPSSPKASSSSRSHPRAAREPWLTSPARAQILRRQALRFRLLCRF
jgi:protein-L-isoaspartate(D-aspartate) O-methyltransferase